MNKAMKIKVLVGTLLMGLALPFILLTIAPHVDSSLIQNSLLAFGIPTSLLMICVSLSHFVSMDSDARLSIELERIAKS